MGKALDYRSQGGTTCGFEPTGRRFQIRSSNCFYLSFMLGQVNFSDISILCNRPNNCCQQNLKCFDEHLFSLGLSHERATISQLTIWLLDMFLNVQPGIGQQCPKCAEMVLSIAYQGKQDSD